MSGSSGAGGPGGTGDVQRVVRRRGSAVPPVGDTGPGTTTGTVLGLPVRYAAALVATVLAVVVLLVASALGDGEPEVSEVAPTTAPSTTVLVVGGPPRSIEVQPDWYRKGYSLYSERGPVPTVSSLPPTTVDEEEDDSDSGSGSGSSSRSGPGSG